MFAWFRQAFLLLRNSLCIKNEIQSFIYSTQSFGVCILKILIQSSFLNSLNSFEFRLPTTVKFLNTLTFKFRLPGTSHLPIKLISSQFCRRYQSFQKSKLLRSHKNKHTHSITSHNFPIKISSNKFHADSASKFPLHLRGDMIKHSHNFESFQANNSLRLDKAQKTLETIE
jgi:hypothetical protein